MPHIKHHIEIIRKLVDNHTQNIHGEAIDNANSNDIAKDNCKPLSKPITADKANVSTLPHRK